MAGRRFTTKAEQAAEHLRREIVNGRWVGNLPGLRRLAGELGLNFKTVSHALKILEDDGLLESQGPGRCRLIREQKIKASSSLRVAILLFEPLRLTNGIVVELQHSLTKAGHDAFFVEKSLVDLGMDLQRVERLVAATTADAWVVEVGSREVLEWFIERKIPAFALFGRRRGLPIASAGPDKGAALILATRRLVELGHLRMVLLARKARRLPMPGVVEQVFLDELTACGISPGPYNLPDWDESRDGFEGGLERLFAVTPPTALIVDEVSFFFATLNFLQHRGLRVPQDVSLICTDDDPAFEWCKPSVAHIQWDAQLVTSRIVQWVSHLVAGKDDRRQTLTHAEFIDGGSIGPVKR